MAQPETEWNKEDEEKKSSESDVESSESNKDSDSDSEDDAGDGAGRKKLKQEACKYYNQGKCKKGADCEYLHVCKYYLNGNCKNGSHCKYKHDDNSDSDSEQPQTGHSRSNEYQWQISNGEKWLNIANDWVIEAQYSLPGAKGITIYNTRYGKVYIDFNRMRVLGKNLRVRRKTGRNDNWRWYFRSDKAWAKYGKKDSKGNPPSVTSEEIEKSYRRNRKGSHQFKLGQKLYNINFADMAQFNTANGTRRSVRRRPQFTGPKSGALNSPFQRMDIGKTVVWQYKGNHGKWHDFKQHYRFKPICKARSSCSSMGKRLHHVEEGYTVTIGEKVTTHYRGRRKVTLLQEGSYDSDKSILQQSARHKKKEVVTGSKQRDLNRQHPIRDAEQSPTKTDTHLPIRESPLGYKQQLQEWPGCVVQNPLRQTRETKPKVNSCKLKTEKEERFGGRDFRPIPAELGISLQSLEEKSFTEAVFRSKMYQWRIQDGEELLTINNDFVLEAHYTQPGAYGITLTTSKYGKIFLDFDKMSIPGTNLKLLRETFLPAGQKEDYGWYYCDNKSWYEYGHLNSLNLKASVKSSHIERRYQKGHSSIGFTAGQSSYIIDFNTMTQTNDYTSVQKQIRRRPKFHSVLQNQTTSVEEGQQRSTLKSKSTWQFKGEEDQWTDYHYKNARGVRCTVSSADIEQNYQQNPQGSMTFSTGRFTYILDFARMIQTNQQTGTSREIRRTKKAKHAANSVEEGQQRSTLKSKYTWQFKGEEDEWTDYQYKNARGVRCTVSSADIEQNYQQNPQGSMTFSTGRFTYLLDFAQMVQINQQTRTSREIRKIKKAKHAANSDLGIDDDQQRTPLNSGFIWQFLGEKNRWTEYQTELGCSVTSADIEQSYQNNPQGSMTFSAGSFTYHLDFSAMMQTNQQTQKRRQVRRTQQSP
uniref:Uncharacterized protein LOC117363647 n=1 Tax=Geotrypetes seraphini TaxID=260995 RepID=A0A6P8RQF0_GEOSA|nr:uncharacterized protein LOC117363647 [Geotrypetes seraphini]